MNEKNCKQGEIEYQIMTFKKQSLKKYHLNE